MIVSSIRFPDPEGVASRLFEAEERVLLGGRASFDVEQDGEELVIVAQAKDATALRAALNSACKTLVIFEKAKGVVDDER